MSVGTFRTATMAEAVAGDRVDRSGARGLRSFVVAAALGWSILFVLLGVGYGLQLYADGSIFSYSVAVHDGWAYHFHNIAGRLFVFVFAHLPAETYVRLTGDARGGIDLYGFLFFAAPLAGLFATYAADRSDGRIIFGCACLSTVLLCPMVFGFPTEMWVAHSLFWPALALCHYARAGVLGLAAVSAALLALVLTHEGALVFAVAILATVALRGLSDGAFLRALGVFVVVLGIWAAVKMTLRPDPYYASIVPAAELNFIDPRNLVADTFCKVLIGALVAYGAAFLLLRHFLPARLRERADVCAVAVIVLALAAYWAFFDHSLHTQNRYYVRTAILVVTPVLGALASLRALVVERRLRPPVRWLAPLATALADGASALTRGAAARVAAGAIAIVMLVHAVETVKFVAAWVRYEDAVRALAMGTASDPKLGDPRFVSSDRIGADLDRLSWSTTTQFLSVLVAPGFMPSRLVVDPHAGYFWLTCRRATASTTADGAIPSASRGLIRVHACLHR